MWTVIDQLSKSEFKRSVAIAPILRVAVDGNKIYQAIADFDEATFTQDEFLELIRAGESYILNSDLIGPPMDEASDDDDFDDDDFEDDIDSDFEDDF